MRSWVGALMASAALGACASTMELSEGMDVSAVPQEEQADYAVFAQRCSKCHSLARPLNSGITDDGYWRMYVEKMKRQPGSGITENDRAPILRFLHWYSGLKAKVDTKADPKPDGGS
jgi:mono/diheme cytochrome c family protein